MVATLVFAVVISDTAKTGAAMTGSAVSAAPMIGDTVNEFSDYVTDTLLRSEPSAEIAQRANGYEYRWAKQKNRVYAVH